MLSIKLTTSNLYILEFNYKSIIEKETLYKYLVNGSYKMMTKI